MHRFYALQLAPTLFGDWILVVEWGRIGSTGTVRHSIFHSRDLAQATLTECQDVKIRRSYEPLPLASA
jgi:predicted DNA-binding WGR domain protein